MISGASRGLGEALALSLAAPGVSLVLVARSARRLKSVAYAARKLGADVANVVGDVSQASTAEEVVRVSQSGGGEIAAVVSNAGDIAPLGPLAAQDPGMILNSISVNLVGVLYLAHETIPSLRRSQGTFVAISSGAAAEARAGWSPYCAAKAGVEHFVRVMAIEEPGIRFLAFRPGSMDTDMQVAIRNSGGVGMTDDVYIRYMERAEHGALRDVRSVARRLKALVLRPELADSGAVLAFSDIRLENLE